MPYGFVILSLGPCSALKNSLRDFGETEDWRIHFPFRWERHSLPAQGLGHVLDLSGLRLQNPAGHAIGSLQRRADQTEEGFQGQMISGAQRDTRPLRPFALKVAEVSFGNVDKIIRINPVKEPEIPIDDIPAPHTVRRIGHRKNTALNIRHGFIPTFSHD